MFGVDTSWLLIGLGLAALAGLGYMILIFGARIGDDMEGVVTSLTRSRL